MPMIQIIGSYLRTNQLQTAPSIKRYVPSFKAEEGDKLEKSSETKDETKTEVEDESETETDSETKTEKDKKDSSSNIKLYVTLGVVAAAAGLALVFKKPLGEWLSKLRKKSEKITQDTAHDSAVTTNVAQTGTTSKKETPTIGTAVHEDEYLKAANATPESAAKVMGDRNIEANNPKNPLENRIVQAQREGFQVHLSTDAQGNTVLATYTSKDKVAGLFKFDKEGGFLEHKTFYSKGRLKYLETKVDETKNSITYFDRKKRVVFTGESVNGQVEHYALYDKKKRMTCEVNKDVTTFYHTNGAKSVEIDNKNDIITVYRSNGNKMVYRQSKGEINYDIPRLFRQERIRDVISAQISRANNCLSIIQSEELSSTLRPLRNGISLDKLWKRIFSKYE